MEIINTFFYTIGKILVHEYFLCFYGVALYYLIIYNKDKRRFKKLHSESIFSGRKWRKDNGSNIALSVGLAPLIVIFDDEIILLYNSISEYDIALESKLVYIMAGPISTYVSRMFTKYELQTPDKNLNEYSTKPIQ